MKTRILLTVLACVAGGSVLGVAANAGMLSTKCTKKTGQKFEGVLTCVESNMTKSERNNPTSHAVLDLVEQIAQSDPNWAASSLRNECQERACSSEDKAKSVAGLNNASVLEGIGQGVGTSMDELTTSQVLKAVCPVILSGYQKTKQAAKDKEPIELNAACA